MIRDQRGGSSQTVSVCKRIQSLDRKSHVVLNLADSSLSDHQQTLCHHYGVTVDQYASWPLAVSYFYFSKLTFFSFDQTFIFQETGVQRGTRTIRTVWVQLFTERFNRNATPNMAARLSSQNNIVSWQHSVCI
ncbi:hypothetical protein AMECASPLE_025100 [Ameca splendens]|uniref:Uncharacterized protein n=1 Tax=Ameca splendens TaxID=208324 RepID=A0ABV0XHJ0_9TELE